MMSRSPQQDLFGPVTSATRCAEIEAPGSHPIDCRSSELTWQVFVVRRCMLLVPNRLLSRMMLTVGIQIQMRRCGQQSQAS